MPSLERHIPVVVDPTGVDASIDPRPMPTSTDKSRAATASETAGEPLLDFEGSSNPYIDYQSIDLLLSLQHPRSGAYDEMCFFVMGQVKELLFRGVHFELVNAQHQIRTDAVENALEILDRAHAYVDYITASWDVLSTITPEGFAEFRDALGPSLYDDTIALLARRGFEIDTDALDRDWSRPYEPNSSVELAWRRIFEEPTPDDQLRRLGRALIAIDEQFSVYRWRHFVSVERIIGRKPGTGGSSGVEWLESVTQHRFFPEIWAIAG